MNPSIVDYLKSTGQASDYASRSALAAKNNISNYSGTADQNTQLLNILKAPKTTQTTTVPTNIPSSAIPTTPPQPLAVPNVGAPKSQIGLNTTVNGVMASPSSTGVETTPTATPESDPDRLRRETLEAIKSYTDPSSGYSAKNYQYEQEAGLADKKNKLAQIDVQDIALQNNLAKLKEEQINKNPGGLFGGGVEQLISANERATSAQRTDLAIQKLALQGDVNTALGVIKQRLDAEFEPIKQKIEYNKEALTLLNNDLSDKEKVQLENQTKMLQNLIDGKKTFQTIMDDAGKGGAPVDVVNQAAKVYSEGDRAQAISLLAPYVKATGEQNLVAGLTPAQATMFNSLVTAYEKSPLVAAYDRTVILRNTIDKVKKNPSDAAQQLNLSYAYIQALDTYQSAVREGELSNLNSVDSKIGSLKNSVDQMVNGQIVRPEVALKIAGAAQDLVDAIEKGAKGKQKDFNSRANTLGLGDSWNQYVSGTTNGSNNTPTSTGNKKTITINGKKVDIYPDF